LVTSTIDKKAGKGGTGGGCKKPKRESEREDPDGSGASNWFWTVLIEEKEPKDVRTTRLRGGG